MKNQITILDMLFEQKNKAYGAYDLRTKYSKHLLKAFVIGTSFVLLIVFSSFIFFRSKAKVAEKPVVKIKHQITDFYQPPIEKEIKKPQEETGMKAEVVETKKFVDPVPVEDEVAQEDPIPSFKDLEDVAIANISAPGIKISQSQGNLTSSLPSKGDNKDTDAPVLPNPEVEIFDRAEIQPSFAGGLGEMYKWLGKNLRYPRAAQSNGTEGKVFVAFVVEKNGSISDVKVVKGIGFGCDEEAIENIKKMPKWNPGMQNGKPVRVRFTIPITFKLN